MPPNVRMGLLQMLLIRALVLLVLESPGSMEVLIPWGDEASRPWLHALCRGKKQDFLEVLAHLWRSGFEFEAEWFGEHFEFCFPRIGPIFVDGGVKTELSQSTRTVERAGGRDCLAGRFAMLTRQLSAYKLKVSGLTRIPGT